jgi:hypothetical protein
MTDLVVLRFRQVFNGFAQTVAQVHHVETGSGKVCGLSPDDAVNLVVQAAGSEECAW